MARDSRIVIVMPAFNEADGIGEFTREVLDAMLPVCADTRILVVDDHSTDATADVLRALDEPRIDVLRLPENRGHGGAVVAGYRAALERGADVVVHVDGDGQFRGEDVARVAATAMRDPEVEVVHGVRRGRTDPWYRRVLSALVRTLAFVVTGRSIPDVNTPLRAYRPGTLIPLLTALPAGTLVPHVHFSIDEARRRLVMRYVEVHSLTRRGTNPAGTTWGRSRRLLPNARLLSFVRLAGAEFVRARPHDPTPIEVVPESAGASRVVPWWAPVTFAAISLATVGVAAVVRAAAGPISRDAGVFLYSGMVVNAGGMPYVDSWDHKGPLVALLNAAGWALAGGPVGVVLLEAVLVCAGLVTAGLVWTRIIGLGWAAGVVAAAALSFVVLSEGGNFTETWLFALQLVAYSLIAAALLRPQTGWVVTAGALTGFAIAFAGLTRMNNAAGLIVALVVAALLLRGARVRLLLTATVGFLALTAPVLAWVSGGNALRAMLEQYVGYSILYSGGATLDERIVSFGTLTTALFASTVGLAAIVLIAARLTAARSRPRLRTTVLIAMIAAFGADAVAQLLSGRGYQHYTVAALAALTLVVVMLVHVRFDSRERVDRSRWALVLGAVLALPLLASVANAWGQVSASASGGVNVASSWQHEMVEYVRTHSSPDETVLAHGAETWILAASQRFSPTSITYYQPAREGFGDLERQYVDEVRADPPALIIEGPNECGISRPCGGTGARFTGLNTFVADHYEIKAQIAGFSIWQRKDA